MVFPWKVASRCCFSVQHLFGFLVRRRTSNFAGRRYKTGLLDCRRTRRRRNQCPCRHWWCSSWLSCLLYSDPGPLGSRTKSPCSERRNKGFHCTNWAWNTVRKAVLQSTFWVWTHIQEVSFREWITHIHQFSLISCHTINGFNFF